MKTPEQKIREKQHKGRLTQDERIQRLNLSWAREFWLLRRREWINRGLLITVLGVITWQAITG